MTALGAHPSTLKPEKVAPGVLELNVYPDLSGFVAIAIDSRGAMAYRIPSPRSPELEYPLLDPISEMLERASKLKVRAYGAWRNVDIHAFPWRGEPLLAKMPVEYSIGLRAPPERPNAGHLLIVGDPTGDLPGALAEARETAELAGDAGAVRLLVRDEATSRAVTDALRGARRFHYAGHGVFAGEEGWESALPLAAGGSLTAPDILALAPAPRSVVLTGCEAAKSAGEAEGMGLAQAFIAAGSIEVLAPVRRVPDELAAKLSAALYHGIGRPLADAARDAILAAMKGDEDAEAESDWAAFRVMVP